MKKNELLHVAKIKNGLKTKLIGRTIHVFRQLPSTNDMAKELVRKGAKEGIVIIAETQTHGKGRLNRRWLSPQGGLWFSIILRPKTSPKDAPKLTFLASVAVAKTIIKLFNMDTEIKWPNDVLVRGKKVCGILTETSSHDESLDFAVVGVGVNVNLNLNNFPAHLRGSLTTLKEELKRKVEKEAFLRSLLEETEHVYSMLGEGKFDAILAEWKRLSKFLGSYVEVKAQDEKIEGWADDIDENGALILKLKDMTKRKIVFGDVTIVKWKRKN